MIINIITYFKKFYTSPLSVSKIRTFIKDHMVKIRFKSLLYKGIDDKVYGTGKGMLLRADKLEAIFKTVKQKGLVFVMSPRGITITVKWIKDLVKKHSIFTIICPRYEGIDQRFIDFHNITEVSVGNFVLFDGDTSCLLLINLLIRYKLLDKDVVENDSFNTFLLEEDKFTRPSIWKNIPVPSELLSGDPKKVKIYNLHSSIKKTFNIDS